MLMTGSIQPGFTCSSALTMANSPFRISQIPLKTQIVVNSTITFKTVTHPLQESNVQFKGFQSKIGSISNRRTVFHNWILSQ